MVEAEVEWRNMQEKHEVRKEERKIEDEEERWKN